MNDKQTFIMIYGAGLSGLGAALLAQKQGYTPFVYDQKTIKEQIIKQLNFQKIDNFSGLLDEKILSKIEFVIKSPGIPDNNKIIRLIKQENIPIIGELEFACRYSHAKLIGITGTNGKTTTTLLLYHILKEAGLKVGLAGNTEPCMSTLIIDKDYDWIILEISSFQLDDMSLAKMDIACILNITPDHLDRYDSFQAYINSKFKILQNMTSDDCFLYNSSDKITVTNLVKRKVLPQLISIDGKNILQNSYANLLGKHNQINVDCAYKIAKKLNIQDHLIKRSIENFVIPNHRLKLIGNINNIEFWNDSKATNLDSARVALEMLEGPIIWIAGGVDKGNDYKKILNIVKKKVKAIICLCSRAEKLIDVFSEILPVYHKKDMVSTVITAVEIANSGDKILLSPACASFDLFSDYKDRGEQFEIAVKNLMPIV